MGFTIQLYEKENGVCPVLDFILELNPKQQAKIYREIDLLKEFGSSLYFPHVRKIEGKKYSGLWELRVKLTSDNFRFFYCLLQTNEYILLHGFTKKSEKTLRKELETALLRMEDFLRRFRR